jgi:hypothetical protein
MTNFEDLELMRKFGAYEEQERIISLLLDLNVIRRCALTNKLVAVTTDMQEVVYLTGFENA